MSAALDTEQCAGCAAVKICTRWNPTGSWDYTKGIEPCRPVPEESKTDKMYVAIHDEIVPITPIIDAEQVQRDRFKLRDLK